MKKPFHRLSAAVLALTIASTAFAKSVDRKVPTGTEPDLRSEAEEVQGIAHRLQGELNFPGSDRLYHEEVAHIDSDVARFNSTMRAHKLSKEQARIEVERIRAEFLILEREVKERSGLRTRPNP